MTTATKDYNLLRKVSRELLEDAADTARFEQLLDADPVRAKMFLHIKLVQMRNSGQILLRRATRIEAFLENVKTRLAPHT